MSVQFFSSCFGWDFSDLGVTPVELAYRPQFRNGAGYLLVRYCEYAAICEVGKAGEPAGMVALGTYEISNFSSRYDPSSGFLRNWNGSRFDVSRLPRLQERV